MFLDKRETDNIFLILSVDEIYIKLKVFIDNKNVCWFYKTKVTKNSVEYAGCLPVLEILEILEISLNFFCILEILKKCRFFRFFLEFQTYFDIILEKLIFLNYRYLFKMISIVNVI